MPKMIARMKVSQILVLVVFCAVLFAAGYKANDLLASPEEKIITAAYRQIHDNSIFDQMTDRELSYASIRGMLSQIEDPYAELIEPQAAQNFSKTFVGQTGVVGLYAENQEGKVVITIVFPGGAAEEAGIKLGDVILTIDDVELDSASDSSETGLMLRGLPDTQVRLKIRRGDQVIDYNLTRRVRVFSTGYMLPEGFGYITLSAFNETATEQMKEVLEDLLAQGPQAIIWDLRSNEGGDMQAAQDILSFFIRDGLLFTAELTQERTVKFVAEGKPLAEDIPLVVLIDKTAYSAAETCAAAIAETGRGKTVGSNSYGKGLIQATIPLQEDTLLQMTIAKWLSPEGVWYQGSGVTPQVAAVDDPDTEADEVLQAAVDLLVMGQ